MKIISNFLDYLKLTNESLYFKLSNNTYGWINDDKDDYINTSMFTNDEHGRNYRAIVNKRILDKSGVISYNLYNIKDFNAAKAIKHNIAYFNTKTELKPDHTISDFKKYTVDYIIRLLNFLDIDIDIVLTPHSSSDFNDNIVELLSHEYTELKEKQLKVITDAFIKTPKNITINKEKLKQAAVALIEDEFEHKLLSVESKNKYINDLYNNMLDYINLGELTNLVEPYYKKIKSLKSEFSELDSNKISDYKKIDELELEINKLENELKSKYPNYQQTKFYNNKMKEWEIKQLPDIARLSLTNMQGFSQSFNDRFIITNKDGDIQSDKTILYTGKEKILIFDDNLSSGATVDDICVRLMDNGVNSKDIIVITLGLVPEHKKFNYFKNKR